MALENVQTDMLVGITNEFTRLNERVKELEAENAALKAKGGSENGGSLKTEDVFLNDLGIDREQVEEIAKQAMEHIQKFFNGGGKGFGGFKL